MRTVLLFMLIAMHAAAQQSPREPNRPWVPPASAVPGDAATAKPEFAIDAQHVYTLPELIDLAEMHNPETRVAWQAARVRASQLHIAQSELFPTMVAIALANTNRNGLLFGTSWARQTVGIFEPFLRVNYLLFDFGERSGRIAEAREQLLAANFAFNSTHLRILFETARFYYGYLNALGQQDAAQANLDEAKLVQSAVDSRLQNGLATLPDALEARSAAAQADYELQAAIGQSDIARGALLDFLGLSPVIPMRVQPLSELNMPGPFNEEADAAIERALKQRPEFAQRVAERQAAQAAIRQSRSAYLPTLNFTGDGGTARAYGQQNQLPGQYAGPLEVWNTSLSLQWTLFDGGRREANLARAHQEEKRAEAEIDTTRDQIELEVWTAYVNLRTAYRQRDAAAALLKAAQSSYDAALQSYKYGVRTTVDVVTAQRVLAQATSQDVAARTALLTQSAAFAYRTGDLLQNPMKGAKP